MFIYYTESFRLKLIQHNQTKHEPKLIVTGVKPHSFTSKYEQLVQKKLREQGGKLASLNSNTATEERPKQGSRKGSILVLNLTIQSIPPTTVPVAIDDSKNHI